MRLDILRSGRWATGNWWRPMCPRRTGPRPRRTGTGRRVAAVLADLESAPIEEPLRATLPMLGKLTAEGGVGPGMFGARWRSAPCSTRPAGSPMPSASRCSARGASRRGQVPAQARLPL